MYFQRLYYNDTFGLFEGIDLREITIHHEQYGGTVHIFIGNRKALCVITFTPSTVIYRVYSMSKGLYHHL
jgi:hypothetical protein